LKKRNLNNFYNFVNVPLKAKSVVSNLIHENVLISDDKEKAEKVNNSSVFTQDNDFIDNIVPTKKDQCQSPKFNSITV